MALDVMEEANRCLQCKSPQCRKGCPIGTNIPEVIRLLKEDKQDEAGKLLFENNPLTTVCSLVCNHEKQCEGNCVLGRKGSPVHFSVIENAISSAYAKQMTKGPAESNGMRVAIIGSGPAGITIAIILARYGYKVPIFEGKDKIGGVLRYGIPEFRLPKSVLDDIAYRHLELKGIKVRPNTTIGLAITIEDLFRDGYKAVFVGTGVWKPNTLGIRGETLGHVHYAIDYLNNPDSYKLGKTVIIIGAVNAAMDVARTAVRKGSETVTCFSLSKKVAASEYEFHHAKEDGVAFEYNRRPVEITDEGVIFVTITENGDGTFSDVEGTAMLFPADSVIISISQGPQSRLVNTTKGLTANEMGLLEADETGHTKRPGVFASGDVVNGARTVVEAVAHSKVVAESMHAYMQGLKKRKKSDDRCIIIWYNSPMLWKMEENSMKEKKRPTIAIMIGNSVSEYSYELMEGFRTCAKEEGVNLVFLTRPYLPQYSREILMGSFAWDYEYQFHTVYDYVHFIKPDVLVIAYGPLASFEYVPPVEEFVAKFADIPCLLLGDEVTDPKIPSLTGGNYYGMRKCVEHLIKEHGYRKIGFVAGPKRNFDSNQRLKAYKDTMEEHGIPVKDSMIVYGNYTEYVDAEVEKLLDQNPDIEAIVFANDNMAKAGYRICEDRDLLIGRDIAITGYDDSDISKTMEPQLTSVAHSSFLFAYRAIKSAIRLYRGEKVESEDLEAVFCPRQSCGCKWKKPLSKKHASTQEIRDFLEKRVEEIVEDMFASVPYEKQKEKYHALLDLYFSDVVSMAYEEKEVSVDLLLRYLKKLCDYSFVSKHLLQDSLGGILQELMEYAPDKQTQSVLMAIEAGMQQYIHAEEISSLRDDIANLNRRNWFIPSFTMGLMSDKSDIDMLKQAEHILKRLSAMGVKSAYLLFFAEVLIVEKGEEIRMPEQMYLAAYFSGDEMHCYKTGEMIRVGKMKGLAELIAQDEPHFLTAFPIFSGKEQYGLLLCEMEQKDYLFMLLCSMQLGSFRRILNMNNRENKMNRELEEKNQILRVISSYDEMSQLLNRRGFMEKSLQMVQANAGKQAYLLFADIDHLKEINDSFGHAAGDFAIQTAAGYLRHCIPANAVTARIGGDEFVSLFVTDYQENDCCELLTRRIEKHAIDFNKSCDKPFYVEISAGIHKFICDPDIDILELLQQSDAVLYEKKKQRRSTIKKKL